MCVCVCVCELVSDRVDPWDAYASKNALNKNIAGNFSELLDYKKHLWNNCYYDLESTLG